jgi:hypothetical protein
VTAHLVPEPNFKENVGPCGCGLDECTAYGTLRVRAWRDGSRCVKRGCPCLRCRGARNKREGARRQRTAARALGVPVSSLSPGHEELALGLVRYEAKSGAQVKPAWTAYLRAEAQSEAARPHGDTRPFVACFEPKDASDGLVCIRRSRLVETVAALAEQLGICS